MNKNLIFITLAVYLTVIVSVFFVNKGEAKDQKQDIGELLERLDAEIKSEHNVTGDIEIKFYDVSKNQAETIGNAFADKIGAEIKDESHEGANWYAVEKDNIDITLFYE